MKQRTQPLMRKRHNFATREAHCDATTSTKSYWKWVAVEKVIKNWAVVLTMTSPLVQSARTTSRFLCRLVKTTLIDSRPLRIRPIASRSVVANDDEGTSSRLGCEREQTNKFCEVDRNDTGRLESNMSTIAVETFEWRGQELFLFRWHISVIFSWDILVTEIFRSFVSQWY